MWASNWMKGNAPMNALAMAWSLVFLVVAPAKVDKPSNPNSKPPDIGGHYEGTIGTRGFDGTIRPQSVHLVLCRRGKRITGSIGPGAIEQHAFNDGVVNRDEAGRIQFTMTFDRTLAFHLVASGKSIEGEVKSTNGSPSPWTRLSVTRVGDLTLSEQVDRLAFESERRSPRLLRMRQQLGEGKDGALAALWGEIGRSGAPLIEPATDDENSFLVTFLWRGSPGTRNVLVLWAPLCFHRPDDFLMSHLANTDLWFRTIPVRRGARFCYQLSPNDPLGIRPPEERLREPVADPLNKRRDPDGRSLVELPGAPAQPWYAKRSDVPHLKLEEHRFKSETLRNERKISVYIPPGYSAAARPYPVLFLFDGEDPDGLVFASWTIENLIADRRIPPLVVVRIANPDQQTRSRELSCSPEFAEFLHKELMPFVRGHYNVTTDSLKTIIGGYSLGGLAAAYAGLRHPENFGLIICQSGSFWWEPTGREFAEPNWLAKEYLRSRKLPLRFYIEAGTDEIDLKGNGTGILVPSRNMRDVLRAKGYEVHYREFAGGHEYFNWRGTLADAIIALVGIGQAPAVDALHRVK
jgi:enterochelin esterase-like enzyme